MTGVIGGITSGRLRVLCVVGASGRAAAAACTDMCGFRFGVSHGQGSKMGL